MSDSDEGIFMEPPEVVYRRPRARRYRRRAPRRYLRQYDPIVLTPESSPERNNYNSRLLPALMVCDDGSHIRSPVLKQQISINGDVLLMLCNSTGFRAHRSILLTTSGKLGDYLERELGGTYYEPIIICIPHLDTYQMRRILDLIYDGKILITSHQDLHVMERAANFLTISYTLHSPNIPPPDFDSFNN